MIWNDIFINSEDLSALMQDQPESLRVFDCRFELAIGDKPAKGKAFFDQAHIAGASYLDLESDLSGLVDDSSSRHPLISDLQFRKLAERFNVTADDIIVCYDQGKLAFAARAWFTFHQFGFHRVRILEGGFPAWQQYKIKQPSAKSAPDIVPVKLPLKLYALNQCFNDTEQLIDAREKARFLGQNEPIDPVAGTIPTAINYPWIDNFDETGRLKLQEWHKNRWQQENSGLKTSVHFCGSGVTALVNVISQLLSQHENIGLYPGGWSEYLHSDHFK